MPQDFSKSKKVALAEGEVLPKDDVTVYGTGGKFLELGKEYVVHSAQAKKLVEAGKATMEAPEGKKAKKGDKEGE